MLKKTYDKINSLFYSIYEKVVRERRGTIFMARYKDRIIGSMICLFSGDTMWEWYVISANKLFHKQYPGVCLTVHALEYCQKHGYLFFNFKDITTPFHRSGVRDFKIQFGGKQRKLQSMQVPSKGNVIFKPVGKTGTFSIKIVGPKPLKTKRFTLK